MTEAIPTHPVQRGFNLKRNRARVPQVVTMAAYEVYSEVHGPQEALITGECRGGFGVNEPDQCAAYKDLESAIRAIIGERDSLAKEVDFLKADIESTEKECDALKARADKLAKHCVVVITERGAASPVVWCTFCQVKSHSLTSALKHAEDCIVEPQTKVATEER